MEEKMFTRRNFVTIGAAASAGILLSSCGKKSNDEESSSEGIPPTEDLMREHGAISRLLLIYEEILNRLRQNELFPIETLKNTVSLIRRFTEDYHEKNEEDYVFPQFEKNNKFTDVVKVLRNQHNAGRNLSSHIMEISNSYNVNDAVKTKDLMTNLEEFLKMYRPHKAWEDTVIFPELPSLISDDDFEKMGDTFEKKEQQAFGEGGFEKIVAQIYELEKSLGIEDLDKFTPKT